MVATLIFKTKNGCLIPVGGQSEKLDKLFKSPAVRAKNIANYNEYTKNFIKANSGSYYTSENYMWDAENEVFNFGRLSEASDTDLDNMFANSAAFDAGKSTDNMKEEVVKAINYIKENMPCPSVEQSGFYVNSMNWNFLCRNIMRKKNTILIGPTGTGKTELVFEIAKKLGLECNTYDMGAMQDPLTDLLGTHRLVNGNSMFDKAKFVEDVQKPGIVLLDELSRAPQMAMNILFPCLDSRRELRLDIADSKSCRCVKVHPECVFIATANIGAEYSGTQEIDAALINRFLPLQLDYMPKNVEAAVLKVRTGVPEAVAKKIADIASEIRDAYKEETISKSVSTRETLNVAEMVADGFTVEDSFRYIVFNKFMDKDEVITLKSILTGF